MSGKERSQESVVKSGKVPGDCLGKTNTVTLAVRRYSRYIGSICDMKLMDMYVCLPVIDAAKRGASDGMDGHPQSTEDRRRDWVKKEG